MKNEIPEHRRHHLSNLTFYLQDLRYEWGGGFGALLKSREKGVKVGNVRMIAGVPLMAQYVNSIGWWTSMKDVSWTVDDCDGEFVAAFKKHLIGL